MDHSTLNTSAKWKKIFCLIMLVFYFSNISVPLGIPVIDTIRDILNILLVIVMLTDIAGEAKKFGDNKKSLLLIPLGAVMIICLQGILWDNIIMGIIRSAIGITADNANTTNVTEMIKKSPIFMGFMACIYGPLLEELLYRYTAFGMLYGKNRLLAYIVPSLLFAFQHVAEAGIWGGDTPQLINIPSYIIAGLIFAFLYARSKNICVPIGAHILTNSFGLFMMMK